MWVLETRSKLSTPLLSPRRRRGRKSSSYSVDDQSRLAWIFTGVSEGLIGERRFGGRAWGDEVDRFDVDIGRPEGALILATSTGHSDEFGIAVEDLMFSALKTTGTQTKLIDSDLTYYVGAGGGAVFSVGSMNWYCSLAWDDHDNDIARLTGNVTKGFLEGKKGKWFENGFSMYGHSFLEIHLETMKIQFLIRILFR